MNRILLLTKIFLKSGFGENRRVSKKKSDSKLVFIILAVFALPMFMFGVGTMMFMMYEGLKIIHQEGLLIGLGYNLVSVMIFIFGMMSVISIFYFSRDLSYILPLPFRSHEITIAKLITVLIYQYLLEAAILIPILGIYGVFSHAGFMFYLVAVVCFLLLPILPLVYCSIIAMLLMRFTNLSKHKDGFRIVTGLFAIFFGVGVNFFTQRMGSSNGEEAQMLANAIGGEKNSLMSGISNFFITSKIGAYATIGGDTTKVLINLGLFILVNILALALFVVIADSLYLKGAVGSSESFSKRKSLNQEELEKGTNMRTPLVACAWKEFWILLRTPAFLLNCISTIVIIPVVLIMPLLGQGNISIALGKARYIFQNTEVYPIILAVIFGVVIFLTATNPTASTAISREGENIYVAKFLPISYETQIMAKVLVSVFINGALVVIMLIGLLVVGASPILVLFAAIISVLVTTFLGMIGVLVDLAAPKLLWDDEQKAVKQNLNPLKVMIIGLIVGGIGVAAAIFIYTNYLYTFLMLAIYSLILNVIAYYIIKTTGVRMFKELGEG